MDTTRQRSKLFQRVVNEKTHPVKLTALLYLKQALQKEQYEMCSDLIAIKTFGFTGMSAAIKIPVVNARVGKRRGSFLMEIEDSSMWKVGFSIGSKEKNDDKPEKQND